MNARCKIKPLRASNFKTFDNFDTFFPGFPIVTWTGDSAAPPPPLWRLESFTKIPLVPVDDDVFPFCAVFACLAYNKDFLATTTHKDKKYLEFKYKHPSFLGYPWHIYEYIKRNKNANTLPANHLHACSITPIPDYIQSCIHMATCIRKRNMIKCGSCMCVCAQLSISTVIQN